MYDLKLVRGRAGLEEISGAWNAVVSQMANPHFFQQYSWYAAYIDTLAEHPDSMLFGVVTHDGVPAAVLPLKQETRSVGGVTLRTLELPRHDHLHLRDIVVRDASRDSFSTEQIVRLLKAEQWLRWDVLALWHVLDDACAMHAHRNAAAPRSITAPRFGCYHLPLAPWDEMAKALSKSFRQNLRTANNRAKAIERLRFEVASTVNELEKALPAFLDVEASGWKAQSGTAIQLDASLTSFYRELIRRFGAADGCEIHLLKINDQPIAGLFVLTSGQTVYLPKVGYDEAHGRLSPVHLLLENLFKQTTKRPDLKHFNLTSDTGWFDTWKPQRSDVHNIYTFNSTLMGLAAYTAMTMANRWRKHAA